MGEQMEAVEDLQRQYNEAFKCALLLQLATCED
jgi:hypothetical protein